MKTIIEKPRQYYIFEQYAKNYFLIEKEVPLKKILKSDDFNHRFKVDYFIDSRLILEVEGAIFINGRHTRGTGFYNDILKYNCLALTNFILIRLPSDLILNKPVVCTELIYKYLYSEITLKYLSDFVSKFKK